MTTSNSVLSLWKAIAVVTLAGCYDFSNGAGGSGGASLSQSDIEHYTFSFRPDPDMVYGGVSEWWFDFEAPFEVVNACNVLRKNYTANSWSLDLSSNSIDLHYDNSESEYYTILSASDDLLSGRFHYENSIGTTPMEGDWKRLGDPECPK